MIKKTVFVLFIGIMIGCAKVQLETAKPIKLDISMRVDVYQHVVNEVNSIEDQIYGTKETKLNKLFSFTSAYAQSDDQALVSVIERRKARAQTIEDFFAQGYIGENKEAYLEVVGEDIPPQIKNTLQQTIADENSDRKIIYEATAKKNNVTVSDITAIFFEDHYKRAPQGALFEVYDDSSGTYQWRKK